jgi:hypothetical protein
MCRYPRLSSTTHIHGGQVHRETSTPRSARMRSRREPANLAVFPTICSRLRCKNHWWFNVDSQFTSRLRQELSKQNISARINAWSGANSIFARDHAARALAKHLREEADNAFGRGSARCHRFVWAVGRRVVIAGAAGPKRGTKPRARRATTRVHHAARRRGSNVAACGACAAGAIRPFASVSSATA